MLIDQAAEDPQMMPRDLLDPLRQSHHRQTRRVGAVSETGTQLGHTALIHA
jgi:hypothetical protein